MALYSTSDAEEVLAKVPRRGIPMILHETRDKTSMGGQADKAVFGERHGQVGSPIAR